MKKILILFISLFSFFNLFSQVNPVGAGRIPNSTTNFTTSVPYGFSLIDANTNKSYRVIRANGLDFNKKLSDYALGTDYLGSLTSLSVICNNGLTKTLTDSTSTPTLTLGLGNITPASISTSGAVTANNLWYLNGNTLGAKKTLGSTDNQDFGIITNNTERLTVLKGGNVGVGTTNPQAKTHILGTTDRNVIMIQRDHGYGNDAFIRFTNSSNPLVYSSYIGSTRNTIDNNASGDLVFGTNNNNILTDSAIERMRITNSGSVGIGTTNPLRTLQVQTPNSANQGIMLNRLSTTSDDDVGLYFNITTVPDVDHNNWGAIKGVRGVGMSFWDGGTTGTLTETMRLKGGKVGIGTTNPFYKTDIAGELRLQSANKLWFGGTTGAGTDYLYSSASGTINTASSLVSTSTLTGTRLISNIAQGTSPLSVTSTTKVPRLNVANSDSLGGYPASHFGTGNGSVTSIATTSPLTGGTITTTGTIAINSDTLLSWARRKDTANIFLGKIRASHEYLGKYANAVSATNATNATLIYNQSDYDDLDVEWRIPFTTFDNNNPSYYYTDSDITWNPFTKKITAGLNGTAAYANKVEIDTIATNLDARIPFMSSTGGNQKLYMDNTIKYNSGTETLTVPNLAGNATNSNKTDSVYITSDFNSEYITYIPFVHLYDDYEKLYANDGLTYSPVNYTLFTNVTGDVTGNATTSTTSGTADVALALDDPTMYNLTDFNSYGAAAYSVPIADGLGGMAWGMTSGGINAKNYATVVATSNVTQSGTGQTIDGQVCNEGATVLCTGQTIKASNGAWLIPESGAWTRRTDMDTWTELHQAYIPIVSGTTYGGSSWYCTIPSAGTLGVTDITFTEFLFPSSVEAGAGLSKIGTTLSTNVDNSTIEIHTDTLRIKDLGITTAKLANSSVTNTKVATGIDATKIADGSISNSEFQYLNGATGTTGTGKLVFDNSPSFTTPTATTAAVGTNTTQIATTAFVQSALLYSPITQVSTASYEITNIQYCIVATSNVTDLYLPPATVSGKEFIIKSAQVQSFTLHSNGTDVIDGYSAITINYWKSFMLKSAGNGHWYILASY